MDWCLAYGSLMDPTDAKRTLGSSETGVAVTIKGWRRDWNIASSRRYACGQCGGLTPGQPVALDLVEDPSAELTAVLIPVSPEQLEMLDEREDPYDRHAFHPGHLYLWKPGPMPVGRFWLYQAKPENRLEDKTRTDVFLAGAYQDLVYEATLGWGEKFARAAAGDIQAKPWPRREGLDFVHDRQAQLPGCSC